MTAGCQHAATRPGGTVACAGRPTRRAGAAGRRGGRRGARPLAAGGLRRSRGRRRLRRSGKGTPSPTAVPGRRPRPPAGARAACRVRVSPAAGAARRPANPAGRRGPRGPNHRPVGNRGRRLPRPTGTGTSSAPPFRSITGPLLETGSQHCRPGRDTGRQQTGDRRTFPDPGKGSPALRPAAFGGPTSGVAIGGCLGSASGAGIRLSPDRSDPATGNTDFTEEAEVAH